MLLRSEAAGNIWRYILPGTLPQEDPFFQYTAMLTSLMADLVTGHARWRTLLLSDRHPANFSKNPRLTWLQAMRDGERSCCCLTGIPAMYTHIPGHLATGSAVMAHAP